MISLNPHNGYIKIEILCHVMSNVKLSHYFPLSKVKNMFLTIESFRKQYQVSNRGTHYVKSSRLQIFFKIGVFKNFAILTGKHQCRNLEPGIYRVPIYLALLTWDLRPRTHRRDKGPGTFTWDLGPRTLHLGPRTLYVGTGTQ